MLDLASIEGLLTVDATCAVCTAPAAHPTIWVDEPAGVAWFCGLHQGEAFGREPGWRPPRFAANGS